MDPLVPLQVVVTVETLAANIAQEWSQVLSGLLLSMVVLALVVTSISVRTVGVVAVLHVGHVCQLTRGEVRSSAGLILARHSQGYALKLSVCGWRSWRWQGGRILAKVQWHGRLGKGSGQAVERSE
jgi:hypothetical protein